MARPRPPSPMRRLRHPNMVVTRNRSPPHVRGPDGLRGCEFWVEALVPRGETSTYVVHCLYRK